MSEHNRNIYLDAAGRPVPRLPVWKIYLLFERDTGRGYVGVTRRPLELRIRDHFHTYAQGEFHEVTMLRGRGAFDLTVLAEALTEADARRKERLWIKLKSTLAPHGYNRL